MQELPHATFHLDPPLPEGTTLYAGPVLLKGWTVGRGGCFITDLRVRVNGGERIFPVFHGHPRPDVAAFLGEPDRLLPAGFEVELLLMAGENVVQFEMCTADGEWRPLAAPILTATPAQPVPWRSLTGTVHPHEFARALRLVLQCPANLPPAHAAAEIAGALPIPFVTRYPALPFHGHLHQPPLLERASFGRLIVEGWLFHETEKIRRVAATVDLQAWTILDYGREQPYVARNHPQFAHAHACRVEGFIDVPEHLPQPLSVRLYAELADGSWHLCHVQRSHIYHDEAVKAPYGPFSAVRFVRAARALRRACLARGLAVARDRGYLRALREVWTDYRARAGGPAAPQKILPLAAAAPAPRRVLLATHNLGYEGAPLFLVEFARELRRQGSALAVVSASEGPLRAAFEELGATVQVIDVRPLPAARTAAELRAALGNAARAVDCASADLVVANTLSSYWAVHFAAAAGRPSLFYIHESTPPDAFYHGHVAPAILPVIKESFVRATHVSFLTPTTRRYYEPILRRSNHSINPGWIDGQKIRAYRAQHSRATLRAQLGLTPGKKLVINVGSVCDRKGQHMFARAVDLLWRRVPTLAAQCDFLLVGGRDTAFDRHVAELLRQLGRPNLRALAETATPYSYYGAADLFVCSSYEESFPRVILEAMAFGLPIVSTNVHGIPEMARADHEARLVPPGNPSALASAMAEVLGDESLARRFAAAAEQRVTTTFDAALLLPRHAALANAVSQEKAR